MDRHLDEEQLFGLAEGGLDASARASAEAHIRGCAECRRELEIAEGYFKRIADLETVKAPANFLANVRARLPRPSPLRAFLDVFMRPLRVIPMQMALLTILGLTAISSYLYQSGGLDEPSQVPMSGTATPDRQAQEPSAAKSEEAAKEHTEQAEHAEAPRPAAPPASPIAQAPVEHPRGPVDKRSSPPPKPVSRSRSKSDSKPFGDAGGLAGSDAAATKDAPQPLEEASPRQAPKLTAGSPAPAEPELAANAVADDQRRTEMDNSELQKREISVLRKGKVAGTAGEKPEADGAGAGAIGSAELPAFIVTLAPGKRIGDVVSGLKAMGADSLSARAARDGGVAGKGMDYMFRVPASMRKDIAPYLERYGRVEGSGLLPAVGTAPARIRIRFLP